MSSLDAIWGRSGRKGRSKGQATQGTLFTLVFIGKICLQELQLPVENLWIMEGLPSVEEYQVMTI